MLIFFRKRAPWGSDPLLQSLENAVQSSDAALMVNNTNNRMHVDAILKSVVLSKCCDHLEILAGKFPFFTLGYTAAL